MYKITIWTAAVTDSGERKTVAQKPSGLNHKFRLLDDDGVIYAYGYSDDSTSEDAFAPLDEVGEAYGCTSIEYKNQKTGKYECL